MVAFGGQTTKL